MNSFIWLSAAAALSITGSAMKDPSKSSQIAPARDGNLAINEELCSARAVGTVAAYDRFLARHPQHPLAEVARIERAKIVSSAPAQDR